MVFAEVPGAVHGDAPKVGTHPYAGHFVMACIYTSELAGGKRTKRGMGGGELPGGYQLASTDLFASSGRDRE
jgi:hypothetical protein